MSKSEAYLVLPDLFRKVVKLMGNRFENSVVSDQKKWAKERIDDAINAAFERNSDRGMALPGNVSGSPR